MCFLGDILCFFWCSESLFFLFTFGKRDRLLKGFRPTNVLVNLVNLDIRVFLKILVPRSVWRLEWCKLDVFLSEGCFLLYSAIFMVLNSYHFLVLMRRSIVV